MTYKNSRLIVVIHLIVLLVVAFVLAIVFVEGNMLFVPTSLLLLLVGVIISLLRYLERTTNDLTRFLLSLREGIFMDEKHAGNENLPDNNFSAAINEITREFGRVAMEKELQYQYLKTLNDNIGAGIISINADGSVRMINPAAKRLLHILQLVKLGDLERVDSRLFKILSEIKPEHSELCRINVNEEEIQLSVQLKEVVLQKENVRIFLLQNINNELEQKEIEAWQQLTGVLTHEIMNSVTPIASLARAVQSIMRNGNDPKNIAQLNEENLGDIHKSVDKIASRSQNLLKFVNNYKAFTRTLSINAESADMVSVTERIVDLLTPDAEMLKIKIDFFSANQSVLTQVDVPLMEQVIINLVKNAMEAVSNDGSGKISIQLRLQGKSIHLSVTDNGKGMEADVVSRIFVPFFSTKTNGSGIGLSLARQIMQAHKGTIKVKSRPGTGTTFVLEWKG